MFFLANFLIRRHRVPRRIFYYQKSIFRYYLCTGVSVASTSMKTPNVPRPLVTVQKDHIGAYQQSVSLGVEVFTDGPAV
jgi:hypothetical protein